MKHTSLARKRLPFESEEKIRVTNAFSRLDSICDKWSKKAKGSTTIIRRLADLFKANKNYEDASATAAAIENTAAKKPETKPKTLIIGDSYLETLVNGDNICEYFYTDYVVPLEKTVNDVKNRISKKNTNKPYKSIVCFDANIIYELCRRGLNHDNFFRTPYIYVGKSNETIREKFLPDWHITIVDTTEKNYDEIKKEFDEKFDNMVNMQEKRTYLATILEMGSSDAEIRFIKDKGYKVNSCTSYQQAKILLKENIDAVLISAPETMEERKKYPSYGMPRDMMLLIIKATGEHKNIPTIVLTYDDEKVSKGAELYGAKAYPDIINLPEIIKNHREPIFIKPKKLIV